MGGFLDVVFGFPTGVFTFALVVVTGYWLLVACGAATHDFFDGSGGSGGGDGQGAGGGPIAAAGLGGVPVTVSVSLIIALAWFGCLTASVPLRGAGIPGPVRIGAGVAVLVLATLAAWGVTRLLARPLRRLFRYEPGPSHTDFVGMTCVIRTGRVDAGFGQAEVTAADGSTAVVQVRQTGEDTFRSGGTALIFAYDAEGGFFWVTPFDAALDPGRCL